MVSALESSTVGCSFEPQSYKSKMKSNFKDFLPLYTNSSIFILIYSTLIQHDLSSDFTTIQNVRSGKSLRELSVVFQNVRSGKSLRELSVVFQSVRTGKSLRELSVVFRSGKSLRELSVVFRSGK